MNPRSSLVVAATLVLAASARADGFLVFQDDRPGFTASLDVNPLSSIIDSWNANDRSGDPRQQIRSDPIFEIAPGGGDRNAGVLLTALRIRFLGDAVEHSAREHGQ